ncbi:MAG: exodeoxyribonuclease VII small subunit [Algisphaera sp.]
MAGKTKTSMKNKALSFEDSVEQLEQLIDRIETGEIGLEDALKHYEDGTKLISHCRKILDSAEKKIADLTQGEQEGAEG